MFKILFFLFIVVPIVEIGILLQISEVIGGWTTILLVIITAYLGAKMVKQQGLQTYGKIQQKTAQGQIPGEELFSGVCILISGVLLLTPGVVTDVLGFLLLTPAVRRHMAGELKKRIHLFAANGGQNQAQFFTFTQQGGFQQEHYRQDHEQQSDDFGHHQQSDYIEPKSTNDVIDGEFTRKD